MAVVWIVVIVWALYQWRKKDPNRPREWGGLAAYGAADSEGDAEPDALASGEPDSDGAADGDSLPDAEGSGSDGTGIGVGSGTKRDGISRKLRTKIATKIAMTAMSHGRARRSLRVGRAPR